MGAMGGGLAGPQEGDGALLRPRACWAVPRVSTCPPRFLWQACDEMANQMDQPYQVGRLVGVMGACQACQVLRGGACAIGGGALAERPASAPSAAAAAA